MIDTKSNEPRASMTFSTALELAKLGENIARKGWNGQGLNGNAMCVQVQTPDSHSKMTQPYLYMLVGNLTNDTDTPVRIPWTPSQADLFANDWFTID